MILVRIDKETYWKKFSNNWFQYDCLTGNIYRPKKRFEQFEIDFYENRTNGKNYDINERSGRLFDLAV
jgi:hypothetical protein